LIGHQQPWNLARLSKQNMSYDSGGEMFDLAKLVSDIYVCGNFHCCIIRSLISSIKGRGLGSTGAIENNNQKRIELDNGTYLLVLVYLCSRLGL